MKKINKKVYYRSGLSLNGNEIVIAKTLQLLINKINELVVEVNDIREELDKKEK